MKLLHSNLSSLHYTTCLSRQSRILRRDARQRLCIGITNSGTPLSQSDSSCPLSPHSRLSLGGDEYIGDIGTFDINACYFPQLTSLKLRRIVFNMFHAVDDFVIKHGATLELEDNGINTTDDYYWSNIWEQFQTELTVLEKLVHRKYRSDCIGVRCCQP
jgi:hypothetical protein